MEKKEYRKKYQREWARNKRKKQKIEKQKNKLANELLFEKAEKEVFKIEAKTYKEENAELKEKINKAIKFIRNYWQDEKEIDNNKLKDDTSYRTLADKTIILIEKSLKGE